MSRLAMSLLLGVLVLVSSPVDAARLRRGAPRQTMSFVPGDRSKPAQMTHRRVATRPVRPMRSRTARGRDTGDEGGDAAAAKPGAGFTMMDGVLTYPAPARFQPKVLNPR